MPISVTCPCGQQFQTRDENAGKRARCPDCERELMVPPPLPFSADMFVISEPTDAVTSDKARASLVLGLCFTCVAVTGIPAIVLGYLALGEINRSKGRVKGSWMAWTGIVLGIFSTLLTLGWLLPATR